MMPGRATGRSAKHRMMTGQMPRNRSNRGTLDAALCPGFGCAEGERKTHQLS